MQRRIFQLLAVICLVALAGCSGALSGDNGPATLDDVTYPAGVTENGTNVSALADAHAEALNGSSFTLGLELAQNGSTANHSAAMHAAVGPDRGQVHVNLTGTNRRMATYLTEEKRYVRTTSNGEPAYRVVERAPEGAKLVPSSYSGAAYLDRYAAATRANFTPTGVRVVEGTPLIVLESDGSNVSAVGANVTDYGATILVDERGVVHSFEMSARTESDGQYSEISFSMALSNVNATTVTEPAWLDEARNKTGN